MRKAALKSKTGDTPAAGGKAIRAASGNLRMGKANDAFEQEADRVAEAVVTGRASNSDWSLSKIGMRSGLQRKCACGGATVSGEECEECKEKKKLQRKAAGPEPAHPSPHRAQEALSSPGRPLELETRSHLESRMGYDFSKVLVHTNSQAAASARAVGAFAYTVGNDIVFDEGRYTPRTQDGTKLIAHELAHIVQQGSAQPVAEGRRANVPRQFAGTPRPGDRHSVSAPGEAPSDAGLVSTEQAAARLRQAEETRAGSIRARGPVRFRVPTTGDLKSLFTSGTVPEDVLKNRVEVALTRMAKEKRLKTKDPIPDVMKKIFPAPGTFDEKAYEEAVDVTNRSQVYQSVLDAEAKVTAADKPKLKTVMEDAAKLIDQCVADDADLKLVFGTKKAIAKANYVKAKAALKHAMDHMDASITTDYNLDDPEVGLGGWATFADQHVHFEPSVVKVTNEDDAKVTIIHESSHLADASVDDKGYYGSHGFEGMSEADKVTNAAHYEEVPMRILKKSPYKDAAGNYIEFKPGASKGGAPLTFAQRAKRKADEYLRKAWDKAVDVHGFIRDIRKSEIAGNHAPFNAHKARLLEISKLMHLTIHEQPPATATVNQMDVVLAEGVAHATVIIQNIAERQTVYDPFELKMPSLDVGFKPQHMSVLNQQLELKPVPGLSTTPQAALAALQTEDQAAEKVIDDSIKGYGALTGSFADDKKLMDWLVANYRLPL